MKGLMKFKPLIQKSTETTTAYSLTRLDAELMIREYLGVDLEFELEFEFSRLHYDEDMEFSGVTVKKTTVENESG